jgi:hypothetical protein
MKAFLIVALLLAVPLATSITASADDHVICPKPNLCYRVPDEGGVVGGVEDQVLALVQGCLHHEPPCGN